MWINTKQGFRKATLLLCSISQTVVPETHLIKPIKRALVVSCCPSNGPWGTVYVKCTNICELIFFSLFFSWHWLGHSGLCPRHRVWRGDLSGAVPKAFLTLNGAAEWKVKGDVSRVCIWRWRDLAWQHSSWNVISLLSVAWGNEWRIFQ